MQVAVAARPLGKQAQQVLAYMVRMGGITPRDAMTFGCYRLAARVKDLREAFGQEAVETLSERHEGGTHARYVWRGPSEAQQELGL